MVAPEGSGRPGPQPADDFWPFRAVRSLTDMQRRGMETAAQVIDRSLGLLEGSLRAPPRDEGTDAADGQPPSFANLRADITRALDLYAELIQRSFEGYADLLEHTLRARETRLSSADAGQGTPLVVQGPAGGRATATVWLHNTGERAASGELHLTDLTAHDGRVVPARRATFCPATVTDVDPDGSASVGLEIGLFDTLPGGYHGHVLVKGLPEAALPLTLTVTPAVEDPT